MNTTTHKTHYETLGVSRETSTEEIRKAYLKLAHKYHPDKTGGDKAAEEMLKEINAAYDTLKNPEKRRQYDTELDMQAHGYGGGFTQGGFRGEPGAGFDFGGFEFGGSGFEDLLGGIFGRGGGRGRSAPAQAGADLEMPVTITLEEAYSGVKKSLRLRHRDACTQCQGSGAAPGTKPETCPQCGGSGQRLQSQGAFSVRTSCARCHGEGTLVTHPCGRCGGSGSMPSEKTISMDIPAGVDTGARLRVAGQGEPGRKGGPAGDLYVKVLVQSHPFFERRGDDLHCEVPVSITQAALGDRVRVPTITGAAELNIREGTQSGAQLRMRGQGMPRLQGRGRGDQVVRILVEVPQKLNKRQRELLRELAEHTGDEHLPQKRGFLDWLKRFRP